LKSWLDAEVCVRRVLEKEFGKPLPKRRLVIGYLPDGTPNEHEFDLVSEDGSVVGEVKSGKDMSDYRFAECCLVCLYLMSVNAERRIFVLTDRLMYDCFKRKISGLAIKDVEVRLIEVSLEGEVSG